MPEKSNPLPWSRSHVRLSRPPGLPDFDDDRVELLLCARRAGIEKIIVVAEDYADSRRVLAVCSRHADVLRPCVGLHPDRFAKDTPTPPSQQGIEAVRDLARRHRGRLAATSCSTRHLFEVL